MKGNWRRWLAAGMAAATLAACPPVHTARAEDAVLASGAPGVSAASCVLYEPESGRLLFEKDAHTARPVASTTKLMTALLAAESGDLDRVVTVTKEAVMVEGTALGLREGDQITIRDLIVGLLLVSGNDAANVLAIALAGDLPSFAEKMNARAQEIGMQDSHFVTPSGLDAEGHAASAYDMALLAAQVLKNEELAAICASKREVVHFGNPPRAVQVSNHNKLLSLYPDAVGMKTGFTKKAGRCLVSAARRDGVTLIAVTLNAGDDWNDHMALYNYGFAQAEAVALPAPELPALPVAGGRTARVHLECEAPPTVVLLKGEAEQVEVRVEIPAFALAPVMQGERVGEVHYRLGQRELAVLPLTAAYTVDAREVAGYGTRYGRCLRQLLWCLLW